MERRRPSGLGAHGPRQVDERGAVTGAGRWRALPEPPIAGVSREEGGHRIGESS